MLDAKLKLGNLANSFLQGAKVELSQTVRKTFFCETFHLSQRIVLLSHQTEDAKVEYFHSETYNVSRERKCESSTFALLGNPFAKVNVTFPF